MPNLEQTIKTTAGEAVAEALREALPTAEYLTTIQAAAYLGLSRQYLEIARHKGEGMPFVKLSRCVRYKRSDLDAYMAARRRQPVG